MADCRAPGKNERIEAYNSAVTQLSIDVNSKAFEKMTGSNPSTSPKKEVGEKNVQHRPILALFCVFMASVFMTLSLVTIKKLTFFDSGQLNLLISIWLTVGNIPIFTYARQSIFSPKKHRFLLLVRAVLSVAGIFCNTLAVRLLPVAEVAIIYSLTPGIITIVARIFLKERFGIVQSVSLIFTILGVLLSVRLPELFRNRNFLFTSKYVLGLVCSILYVIICGFVYMLLRLTKYVHFALHNFYGGVLGLVTFASLTAGASVEFPRCGSDSFLTLSVGFLAFIGYNFITIAVQLENVGIVMMVKYSIDVIIALIFQIIFFLQYPEVYNTSGAVIVLASATVVGISRWLHLQPEDAKIKKKLKFLLL